jgi:5-formyltetrahydrofolate cyclo-ligase
MLGEIDLSLFNERLSQEGRLVLPEERDCPVDLILVPGLAFDSEYYRLGYGKGYYDRLLAETPHIPAWGVGFHEQMSPEPLPRDTWDLPVQKVLLF